MCVSRIFILCIFSIMYSSYSIPVCTKYLAHSDFLKIYLQLMHITLYNLNSFMFQEHKNFTQYSIGKPLYFNLNGDFYSVNLHYSTMNQVYIYLSMCFLHIYLWIYFIFTIYVHYKTVFLIYNNFLHVANNMYHLLHSLCRNVSIRIHR